jgi:S-formylglutathione hydrolase FrmB
VNGGATRMLLLAAAALLLTVTARGQTPASAGSLTASPQHSGHYERVAVHGRALEGNLEGDSPDRMVSIYLPPSYAKSRSRRFPVLYLLHGFTDSDSRWYGLLGPHFVDVPTAVDGAFEHGVREMIVVTPDAYTKYWGSMYSNSVVVGDWEAFIAEDLVAYIDGHYRTLPRRESRGLAGHSMGGYGTIRISVKYPQVFSSIYAMSPCCLSPNSNLDMDAVGRAATVRNLNELGDRDFMVKAVLATAAAWSPNPAHPPLFLDLPVVDGKTVPETLAKWGANAPLITLHQHVRDLKRLNAIAFDAGDQEQFGGILPSVQALDQLLTSYGIVHVAEVYPGDHINRIAERLQSKVLPYFGEHLKF